MYHDIVSIRPIQHSHFPQTAPKGTQPSLDPKNTEPDTRPPRTEKGQTPPSLLPAPAERPAQLTPLRRVGVSPRRGPPNPSPNRTVRYMPPPSGLTLLPTMLRPSPGHSATQPARLRPILAPPRRTLPTPTISTIPCTATSTANPPEVDGPAGPAPPAHANSQRNIEGNTSHGEGNIAGNIDSNSPGRETPLTLPANKLRRKLHQYLTVMPM